MSEGFIPKTLAEIAPKRRSVSGVHIYLIKRIPEGKEVNLLCSKRVKL